MRGFRLIAMAHTVTQAAAQAINMGLDRLDAQLLLLHVLRKPPSERAWLLAHDTDVLTTAQHTDFMALVQRRAANEPLAYLTGHKEFYGLDLHVDRRVLVPRPDTETLVDWALEVLSPSDAQKPLTVIDLGTGSGAVALAIQHTRPDVQVQAVDFSTDALAVAQANAQRLGLAVEFSQGSWLSDMTDRFHLIVSNPPYIAARDPHLDALTHEPLQALASGSDGLDDIRQIIAQAPAHLHPEGWLLLEHGYDQADAVRDLLSQAGFTHVQSRCDLAGIERCSGGTWLNPCFARGSTQPDRS
jgi:release factor glutamine methyltransferase